MPEQPMDPVEEPQFTGMHHDVNAKIPPGEVLFASNFYLEDGRWIPRPGTDQLGGSLGTGKVQGIVGHEELDGTVHILAFVDGDMHTYDEGTDSWSTTDLSNEGITLSGTEHLDFANSRGRLIVTDGVNKPFMWDPNAGTFTTLSAAPIAEGVTVYYDQVFFFDISGEEVKFEWSAIADPTDGYDADGNSWEFVQTDAGRVRSLAAMNNVLVVFKEDSATHIQGAISENFSTNAVREGLSESEGAIAGRAVVIMDGDIFFLSQSGPRVAIGGQRLANINESPEGMDRLRDTWSDIDRSTWSNAVGVVDTQKRHVWFALPDDDFVLVYAVDEDAWSRFTFPWKVESLAEVEYTTGQEYILIGDDDGNVYRFDPGADGSEKSDAGNTSIEYKLRSRLYGAEQPSVVKRLVEVHLTMELDNDLIFELRPVKDGEVQDGITAATMKQGQRRYRRGFNAMGTALGWEFYMDELDQNAVIEAATTILTLVGTYPTI